MNELALFAGAGGGLLGGALLGWRTVCAVEIDPYCRKVLLERQRDGCLPRFPIWDDIRTFDGRPWRGSVDVISGGFPCQDISSAGKRQGLAGKRSGLWYEMLRVVGEVQPTFVFAENSPHLRTRGLGIILEGLAGLGYDAQWGVLGARHAGAPHRRDRLWIVATNPNNGWQRKQPVNAEMVSTPQACAAAAHPNRQAIWKQSRWQRGESRQDTPQFRDSSWWSNNLSKGMVNGLAHRMDRVRATGNGQVPAVAAIAWTVLSGLYSFEDRR